VQVFADGAWTIYWLYDKNDGNPATAHWVNGALAVDRGNTVIPPGQGIFFNNRGAPGSLLAYGEIRENNFIRPLATGNNLVGGGYPVDQSATGVGSRAMNLGTGFFGSRDFKTADSIFVWRADAAATATGYVTFYLLHSTAPQPLANRWVRMGDVSLLSRDAEVNMLGNRAVFVRSKNGLPLYTIPSPWAR
jgi:hypothetical protein